MNLTKKKKVNTLLHAHKRLFPRKAKEIEDICAQAWKLVSIEIQEVSYIHFQKTNRGCLLYKPGGFLEVSSP